MKTSLTSIKNGVNLLSMSGIRESDIEEVDSWLFTMDFTKKEREQICDTILKEGRFCVCHIEYRVELCAVKHK